MKPVYYVYNTETGYTKYQHDNPESAKKEAERLARSQPGSEFQILEAIAQCKVVDVVWESTDAMPF